MALLFRVLGFAYVTHEAQINNPATNIRICNHANYKNSLFISQKLDLTQKVDRPLKSLPMPEKS